MNECKYCGDSIDDGTGDVCMSCYFMHHDDTDHRINLDKVFGSWEEPKCECGSEKTNQPKHSEYCPKYDE